MGLTLGQVVDGKYRVTACIGEGGMGAVYAGEHLKLHRRVAIKVLHAAVAIDPEVVTRFEREAQAAGRIGNDHILEVFDIGELPGGDRYMVMEFLDGEAMNSRFTRLGRVAPRQIYPLVRQLLEGLGAAHAAGIVHRDLKPANVFILREKMGVLDYVKIIDFGISKFQSTTDAPHNQTRTGTIIGTPAYMAPEQARGLREADARTDIYAVGVILYEAVTGRCPFEGTSTNDLLFKIFLNEPTPIDSIVQDVDPAFGSLVMKALAKEPGDRYARAEEFIAALDAWAQTGQGVAVAQTMTPATLIERSPSAVSVVTPPQRSDMGHAPTQGAWGDSRSGSTGGIPAGLPTARSQRALWLALSAAAVLLIGSAAVVANRLGAHETPPAPTTAAAAVTPPPSPSIPPPPAVSSVSSAATDPPPAVNAAIPPPDTSSKPPAASSSATGAAGTGAPKGSATPSATATAPTPAHPRPHPPKGQQPPANTANPFEDR